ncbi:hypothetical protein ACVWWO_003035 [Bradyrhizobium sp. F1.13.1]
MLGAAAGTAIGEARVSASVLLPGALAAGLAADAYYGPRYYGPPYGYYGPRVVRRAYYVPYAYAPPPYWDPWW